MLLDHATSAAYWMRELATRKSGLTMVVTVRLINVIMPTTGPVSANQWTRLTHSAKNCGTVIVVLRKQLTTVYQTNRTSGTWKTMTSSVVSILLFQRTPYWVGSVSRKPTGIMPRWVVPLRSWVCHRGLKDQENLDKEVSHKAWLQSQQRMHPAWRGGSTWNRAKMLW